MDNGKKAKRQSDREEGEEEGRSIQNCVQDVKHNPQMLWLACFQMP